MFFRSLALGGMSAINVTSMCVSWNCSIMARCSKGIVAFRKLGAWGSSTVPLRYASSASVSLSVLDLRAVSRCTSDGSTAIVWRTARWSGIAPVVGRC
ncbi:hypothetical protein PF010_g12758 [Phytophthora fragariae]|uniref:Secreted protein n=2 Tax=Phytophthora TaxID=4783 RepID=A0A6A3KHZ0_9STRA|nr:hypothetical protein PR001_g21146 [Phytophthora rubi]KAE9006669.1 hypothetical protein PF011_g11465 [Phytophthora fragariae]KAE9106053.1 hypothetical protein PF010_g12758 [Phytophthora fragariae]KAE9143299.1 hypothetical protein PF006_g11656 [Phytophthora fragariae]KAE9305605.1 hypothetical protein PF001_g12519 [Phytophthora fragariae]